LLPAKTMKKSISMFDDLIHQVNKGIKTQTIRLIKSNTVNTIDFKTQFETCNHSKNDYKDYPALQLVLTKFSRYFKGDILSIENSKTVIEILTVRLDKVFNITDEALEKEGIKSQPNSTAPNVLVYYDYLSENFSLNTIRESYKTLMVKCYGSDVLQDQPYVFVYTFKVIE